MNRPNVIIQLSRPNTEPAISTPPVDHVVPLSPAFQLGWGVSVQPQSVDRVIGGTSVQVTTDDRINDVTQAATVIGDWQLAVIRLGDQNSSITYDSNKPEVATVDANGYVSFVSIGKSRIRVKHGQAVVDVALSFSQRYLPEAVIYVGSVPGSVRENATLQIDDQIDGGLPSTDTHIFSAQDHTTPSYVRDTSCWAQGFSGMTGISPWNSSGAHKRAGVAVTPRHIIFAKHFQIGTDSTVRFVTADNTIVERTMIAKQSLADTDLTVGLLDSDLPPSIEPVKVLPSDWVDYFPSGLQHIPSLALDQEEKALITNCDNHNSNLIMRIPTEADRLSYYEPIIGGDSGNPAFLVISGQLVLITTWWFGGAGSGPFIPSWRTEIEAAITSLGAFGHSLTDVDLSSFTDFS